MPAWEVTGETGRRTRVRLTEACPDTGEGQVLVELEARGVCRTGLHVTDSDLLPRGHGVIPGHNVAGTVVRVGSDVHEFRLGTVSGSPGCVVAAASAGGAAAATPKTCVSVARSQVECGR